MMILEFKITLNSSFSFRFRPSVFAQTLFFCNFWWPRQPYLHYIDVYYQRHDTCHLCFLEN
ncbi:hypothetical protein Lalb_Chr11g0065371 [Lupinus albus]|uniref:S-protein homolog n=1 Tax=Lupinus albus TaxID=3870 RepID=A0A6A4PQR4_LUPAL|nr:hypothetical protein Lalb_Chr11g0065371 [Lupinus albus]